MALVPDRLARVGARSQQRAHARLGAVLLAARDDDGQGRRARAEHGLDRRAVFDEHTDVLEAVEAARGGERQLFFFLRIAVRLLRPRAGGVDGREAPPLHLLVIGAAAVARGGLDDVAQLGRADAREHRLVDARGVLVAVLHWFCLLVGFVGGGESFGFADAVLVVCVCVRLA
jgi:hypothetical protein